ncbi:CsrA RNA-binding global regulator CsrA [uncultured Caudovirales phage]|uniref:CsrA RNA-binding global regulator CsrA n=1 Tax=uncultured Caudovirales phage TaxID=2100421 RepID=A0A6J5RGU0_9CAUD|nr:CsrA RNA-binding global regulator CsrA [uncultured Caudovirales phage]
MLVLTRKKEEKILIGDDVVVQVLEIRGDKVRLGITAPRDVRVDREEVREDIKRHGVDKKPADGTFRAANGEGAD